MVLAAIRPWKGGTTAEVNNCSVSACSSVMIERLAVLVTVAVGQARERVRAIFHDVMGL